MNKYRDDSDIITIPINMTKSGLPSLWEEGGKWDSYGEATLIAGSAANKKNGLYYKCKYAEPNGKHVLLKISENNVIMFGRCTNGIKDTIIIIRRVYKINIDEKAAYLKMIFYGKPENVKDKMYFPMIHAMLKKLSIPGCTREIYAFKSKYRKNENKTIEPMLQDIQHNPMKYWGNLPFESPKTFKQILSDMPELSSSEENEFENLFEDFHNDFEYDKEVDSNG